MMRTVTNTRSSAVTSIRICAAPERARLHLTAGLVVPRVISQTATTAKVALVAGGALLLGGDEVEIDIAVGEGCLLELEDIGGTVAYNADERLSTWTVRIAVAARGTLLWHGLPFVVATGANVDRRTTINLAPKSAACLRETVVLGRSGEAGGRLHLRSEVLFDGSPLFVEELDVVGGLGIPGVLGERRVLDNVLLLGTKVPESSMSHSSSTVLEFDGAGALARVLEDEAHLSTLDDTWTDWRQYLLDEAGIPAAAQTNLRTVA